MPYESIPAGSYDADSPITDEFLDALVGNAAWLKALLESHVHSGDDGTTEIEVGSNSIRNGSFESGTVNWTISQFTGGTIVTNTANDMDGATGLAITSSTLANGGGSAITDAIPCSGGVDVDVFAMVKASVANVSGTIAVLWLNDAKAQISESTILSSSALPTTQLAVHGVATAPATARYYQVRLIGGFPALGSATGTVYFDGVFAAQRRVAARAGSFRIISADAEVTTTSVTSVEACNFYVPEGGVYRIAFELCTNGATQAALARIYLNGVAYGTARVTTSLNVFVLYSEDLAIPAGSTVQIFYSSSDGVAGTRLRKVSMGVANKGMAAPVAIAIGER